MRYIPIEEIANEKIIRAFERLNRQYVQKMQGMTTAERKAFIKGRTIWNKLQRIFYALSETKCWYSEAPPGAADFVIDHFRPKNRSIQHDRTVLRQDGYWWLAYEWRNYRLIGGLINIERKDRFGSGEMVKGKGAYFPLDIDEGSIIADFGDNLRRELPILLDPTNRYDVTLLAFDKNGEPIIPSDISELDKFRAEISIKIYHLDLEQLNHHRRQVWNVCEEALSEINIALTDAANEFEKRAILRIAGRRLYELTNKKAPFSMVAWACIEANTNKYISWLSNLKRGLY